MNRTAPTSQPRGLVYPVVRPLPRPTALDNPGVW
jgi:hypothetical protein